jgi:hypothetical protein
MHAADIEQLLQLEDIPVQAPVAVAVRLAAPVTMGLESTNKSLRLLQINALPDLEYAKYRFGI